MQSCWDIESAVEAAEAAGETVGEITVTDQQWETMTVPERVHLELFLAARADPRLCGGSYIGSPSATILLVGDIHNGGAEGSDYRSAFGPWHGCGPYLMKALDGLELSSIGICNVYEHPPVERLVEILGVPDVVALGNRASARLGELRVIHRKVPHPQWWRRFRHGDLDGYRSLLQP